MKKGMIGIVVGMMVSVLAFGSVVSAAEISADDAVKTVLDDAGIDESGAIVYKQIREFSDGTEKFEISFLVPGQEKVEYEIETATGKIMKNEKDLWEAEDDLEYGSLTASIKTSPEELEKAIQTALADAGVNEADVIVYKKGTDFDNGTGIFDIHFFKPGTTKYEYEIGIATGNIMQREQEPWDAEDDLEYAALISPEAGKETAPSGKIDEAAAKSIALNDAGFDESAVTITECSREMDDGVEMFNVSFRTSDGAEYEYDIAASDGRILDKDMEYDD